MGWTRAEPGYVPPELDITKPSVTRAYDAILSGKDNFAVDRAGVTQFLDLGSGLPAAQNTHQIARPRTPE
jgi:hypothetical protein